MGGKPARSCAECYDLEGCAFVALKTSGAKRYGQFPENRHKRGLLNVASEGVEGLAGKPRSEKVSGPGFRKINRRNALGQRHARESLIAGQKPDAVIGAGLRLMVTSIFQDQSIRIRFEDDISIEIEPIPLDSPFSKCMAKRIAK